jgi:glucokinase
MKLKEGRQSALRSVSDFDGKAIMDAAQSGDKLALEAVDRMAEYLGWALANISDLIDPEIYTIGGGLSHTGNFLLEKIKVEAEKRLTYPQYAMPEIVLAKFRNEAGIIGAANLKDYL